MLAYCTVLGVSRGHLLYADGERPQSHSVRNATKRFTVRLELFSGESVPSGDFPRHGHAAAVTSAPASRLDQDLRLT